RSTCRACSDDRVLNAQGPVNNEPGKQRPGKRQPRRRCTMKMNAWLGATALLLTLGAASGASALTLKAAHYLPPTHPIGLGYQTFADELKKNTDGEISVRIFPGESLLAAKALSDGIRDRVADLGFDTLTYTPSYYP